MSETVSGETIKLLLLSIFKQRGEDGLVNKFMFGEPGAPHWAKSLGTEIYFRRRELIRAALYIRQNGPAYLRSMSMSDIQNMLRHFITQNYWYLSNETFLQKFDCSYAEHVSNQIKAKLIEVFATSDILAPQNQLTLYPLVPVRVGHDFVSEPFFLVQPSWLSSERLGLRIEDQIKPDEFPPLSDWRGVKEKPQAWLGVRTPVIQASNKMKAAILGAVALTPHSRYRHQFSGRQMFGGRCTIDASQTTTSYGDAHTPPMSEDIAIGERDHAWLAILAPKLLATDEPTRRQVRALEYFYRAWPLYAPERFPHLFMALDAIYGDAGQATQAVIDAVGQYGGEAFEYRRLKMLLSLRGSVIHGGAPDVYDSKSYHRYYETYLEDPIFDLELITAQCFRSSIFGGALIEHPDPHAELIRAYREGTLKRS
jgi:hypothetical protein